jgi:hypothetical protein
VKIVVEALGRVYCVELSGLICKSVPETGQVLQVGGMETAVDEEAASPPFGFAPRAREG